MKKEIQCTIKLSKRELKQLQDIKKKGKHSARTSTRTRVLLLSHRGIGKDALAAQLETGRSTVQHIRDRYRSGGLEQALYDAPRSGQPPKITKEDEAFLVATACSSPPDGQDRWTLEFLRQKLRRDRKKQVSTVAIWYRLDNLGIKPWREKNVVHPVGHSGVCQPDGATA